MHKTNFEKLASDDPRISDSNVYMEYMKYMGCMEYAKYMGYLECKEYMECMEYIEYLGYTGI